MSWENVSGDDLFTPIGMVDSHILRLGVSVLFVALDLRYGRDVGVTVSVTVD
jgi:hypothetical protein